MYADQLVEGRAAFVQRLLSAAWFARYENRMAASELESQSEQSVEISRMAQQISAQRERFGQGPSSSCSEVDPLKGDDCLEQVRDSSSLLSRCKALAEGAVWQDSDWEPNPIKSR